MGIENRPIRVWMVQHMFFPLWAGPAERFFRYRPGLLKRGIELSFITAHREGLKREEFLEGARIIRVGKDFKNVSDYKKFTVLAILRAIKDGHKPDVLLFFGLAPVHIPFLMLLKVFGIRSIFINTMSRKREGDRRTVKAKISDTLHKSILALNDRLVFSTSELSKYLDDLNFGKEKVWIIPNGVNLNKFKPLDNYEEKKNLRSELHLPETGTMVLYVGVRVERKGVIELLEGWKIYKENGGEGFLVLVGQDQRERKEFAGFYEKWDALVNSLQPKYEVFFKPSSREVDKYFHASDLFMFLSKHEGMPNVLLEAMACGLPVVLTQFEGFSDDFGRNENEFLITDHDPKHIARDLKMLLGNPAELEKYKNNSRAWIEKYQDVEVALDKYASLIKETVKAG